jgi:NAD(P)-dependent dehydrogenase (short-subunit alcohol dehydrogenase family)
MSKGLFDLTGKVAVVTGGNSGLGLGFARGIAKQGGDVSIWARSAPKMAKAKEDLERFGGRVTTHAVDVSSEAEVIAAFDKVIDEFGRVDCVIANSGLPPTTDSILDMPTETYHGLLAVNQHGAFYTLREGARRMVKRAEVGEPGGSLIFCGSLSMFFGLPGKGHYAAAKGAMAAMVRSLACEVGKYNIRVNSIAPGYIKTGMEVDTPKEIVAAIDAHFSARAPIGRPGYPEDFEAIAAYLASDSSSFMTGETIVIDGGHLVNM